MEELIGKEYCEAFKQRFNSLFLGNQDAVDLAMDILYVVHVWDDLIDDDPVPADKISIAFRKTVYDIPMNPVMCRELSILWLSCYHQWEAANYFEANKSDDRMNKAYMLRASIYQLFNHIATIVGGLDHGKNVAKDIYDLYGETLEDVKNA